MNKKHIRTLTSLRFFASLAIVIHHLRYQYIPTLRINADFGILGVTFFLVLSGFIIRYNYAPFKNLKEASLFVWNRAVRIYPLHIITFLSCLLIFLMKGLTVDARLAFINIMLLQSYFPMPSVHFSFNPLSWMLSTLFSFYLLFAAANLKHYLFRYMVVFSIASLLFSVYYIETNIRGAEASFELWLLYIFPLNRFVTISLGVLACAFYREYVSSWCNRLGIVWGTLLEAASLLLIFDFFWWRYFTRSVHSAVFAIPINLSRSWNTLIPNYLIATPLLFILILIFTLQKGIFSKVLQTRFCVYLGEMSFSIYMIHQIMIDHFFIYGRKFLFSFIGQTGTVLLVIIFIIFTSFLVYKYIEDPIRHLLRVRPAD